MRKVAKLVKIAVKTFWFLGCLILLLFAVINSNIIQKKIIKQSIQNLSVALEADIHIRDFSFKFPNTIQFEGLYISDQEKDTLGYFNKLSVSINQFHLKNHFIGFKQVTFEGAIINLGIHELSEKSNYLFLIHHFAPPREDTLPPPIWTLSVDDVFLENTSFRYFNHHYESPDFMDFDPNNMHFENIQASLSSFKIIGDSLSFNIKNLSCVEHSGIKIKHLNARTQIHSQGMEFKDMKLIMPHSIIGEYLKFSYNGWEDFSNFIHDVEIEAELLNSTLSLSDLHPYNHKIKQLKPMDFRMEGDVRGTIDRLKLRNVNLSALKETKLSGKFDITGLPVIENTYLNFDISNFHSSVEELFALLHTQSPPQLRELTSIDYSGMLTGFFNNFVSFGNVKTNLGNLSTDLNLDFRNGLDQASYSGKLKSEGIALGKLLNSRTFGDVAFEINIKNGLGLDRTNFSLGLDGEVRQFYFNGYNYKATIQNGNLSKDLFDGHIVFDDPNIKLDFNGLIDLHEGAEKSIFTAHIEHLNLKSLGFDTANTQISGLVELNTLGLDIDNISGSIKAKEVSIKRNNAFLTFDSLYITSNLTDKKRDINLISPFMNVKLTGNYQLKKLPNILQRFGYELLPGFVEAPKKVVSNNQMDFTIQLKDIESIRELFTDDFEIGNGIIQGNFNSELNTLQLNGNLSFLKFGTVYLKNMKFYSLKEVQKELVFNATGKLQMSGSRFKADSIQLYSNILANKINYKIKAIDEKEDLNLRGEGSLIFDSKADTRLNLDSFLFHIKGKDWVLKDKTWIQFGENVSIEPLELSSKNEMISTSFQKENGNTNLFLTLKSFDLTNINGFLPETYPLFSGTTDGSISFSELINDLRFISLIEVAQFAINKDTVGNIKIDSERRGLNQNEINATITNGIFNGVALNGVIGKTEEPFALDLALTLPESNVQIFNQFLPGISNLQGTAQGVLAVGGTINSPIISGRMDLKKIGLIIDYLQVPFTIESSLVVSSNTITIGKNSILEDDKGKKANLTGYLKHTNFTDWSYQLYIENMRDFHALATEKKDNELFYGQAYVDGSGTFFGTFSKFNMSLEAKTKSGTIIRLPIGESEASGPAPYISFKTEKIDTLGKITDIGFLNTLFLGIEITPAAEIQLIFDEQTGDIIKGSGSGRLLMEVKEDGDFTMRGGITVERGDYQYVAFNNIVNKRFFIERGGTITWDGDPLQARINLQTYNLQMANPNPLLGRSNQNTGGQSSSTVQARSEIKLKGNLFKPEISFGFDIQNLLEVGMSELSSVVQRIKNDADEINRQVFSLLVFGSFIVPTFISSQDLESQNNALTNGLADIISNQIDAWLTQIDPKWLVDFSFASTNPDQRADMIFRLGRKFANERIILDVTYGTNQAGPANNSINMEYLATRDGRFRLKAFSRTAAIYNNVNAVAPVNTIGIGVFYRREFNNLFKSEKADSTAKDTLEIDSTTNIQPDDNVFLLKPYPISTSFSKIQLKQLGVLKEDEEEIIEVVLNTA